MSRGSRYIKYNSPLSECPLLISEIAQSVCLSRALTHVALAGGAAAGGSTTSTTGCVDKKPLCCRRISKYGALYAWKIFEAPIQLKLYFWASYHAREAPRVQGV